MLRSDPLVTALVGCSYAPGTWTKRFVRDLAACKPDYELTPKQEACIIRLGYTFRHQLSPDLREFCVSRKVDHVVTIEDRSTCATCHRHLSKRDLNGPCPGPPTPRAPRKKVIDNEGTTRIDLSSNGESKTDQGQGSDGAVREVQIPLDYA